MSSRILSFVLLLCLAALVPQRAGAEAPEQQKLNIVFFLIDDMGWKDLGCYGSTFYETPNTDKLAGQGMRFTNAYAACPVCSPTRASIMTGKYPARLHITTILPGFKPSPTQKLLGPKNLPSLPLTDATIAKELKALGYTCGIFGKWHLGGPPDWPVKHGFDVNFTTNFKSNTPENAFFNFDSPNMKARNEEEYLTDRLTEESEKFIEKHKDKPFFLYLPHNAVHVPLQAKKDLIAKYQAKAKPDEVQKNPVYAAMIESVDDSVGRIMKKLDDLHIADRTVIFFMSDNGGLANGGGFPHTPATSNAPLRAGKGYLYEGGIREPMIVRWPGTVKPGSTCDVPVSSVDFFPTILEMTGVKSDPKRVIDGTSFVPLLKQSGELKRDSLFWHYPYYTFQENGWKPGGAVRRGDLKLIEFYEDGKLELYDLAKDIGEKEDLSEKMPGKTKELHQALAAWRKSVDAVMPKPNPDYKGAKKE